MSSTTVSSTTVKQNMAKPSGEYYPFNMVAEVGHTPTFGHGINSNAILMLSTNHRGEPPHRAMTT